MRKKSYIFWNSENFPRIFYEGFSERLLYVLFFLKFCDYSLLFNWKVQYRNFLEKKTVKSTNWCQSSVCSPQLAIFVQGDFHVYSCIQMLSERDCSRVQLSQNYRITVHIFLFWVFFKNSLKNTYAEVLFKCSCLLKTNSFQDLFQEVFWNLKSSLNEIWRLIWSIVLWLIVNYV